MHVLRSAQISSQFDIRITDIDIQTIHFFEDMVFGATRATEQKLEQVRAQQGLLLSAYAEDLPVGFKLGYVIKNRPIFFSWLGGVHPGYRRQGIAQALLEHQERYVKTLGLGKIYFTTFHRFPEMIRLGKKNGYLLVKTALDEGEEKYWYEKQLI